ncbi:MAG: protein kinase, partial [Myxococcota bacterium]|nr:protein kinase [Myxococcota bacterium]
MDQLVNLVVAGKYKVIRLLGVGGMGEVYEAWHQDLERFVAIKVLRSGIKSSGEAEERFKREAKASAAIGHPNIIQVFDFGK